MSVLAIAPGRLDRLSPLVRRLTQNNPGPMTGPGTNTYLIGRGQLFVLDPGEEREDHLRALLDTIGSARVVGIAPTHAHPDHWPLAPKLAREVGAPTYGWKAQAGYRPDRLVADGETIRGSGWTLGALHTPGHTGDHVAYLLAEERALFTGDHVMKWSTSVIARPDGSLASYLASLERVRALDAAVLYPAHGEPIADARARIDELIEHRRMREAQILAALSEGASTLPEIVACIYVDADPRLHGAAAQSVHAHLEALLAAGRVAATGSDDPTRARYELISGAPGASPR